MAYFAVTYTYANRPDELDRHRPAHRAHLTQLAETGAIVASGPLLDTSPATALLVMVAADEQQVRSLLADDPFQQQGLVERTDVVTWNPVIGILASSPQPDRRGSEHSQGHHHQQQHDHQSAGPGTQHHQLPHGL